MKLKANLKFVLFFKLDQKVMLRRLTKRAQQSKNKRYDDKNPDIQLKRIKAFMDSTEIFNVYKPDKFKEISAQGSISKVFNKVKVLFTQEGMHQKNQVVFVMGGPGSGKGTQCKKIIKAYPKLDSFSCGDLLRAKAKEDSEEGRQLDEDMKQGKLVSSDITVRLMEEYMWKSSRSIFLIDGFPRN